MQLHTMWMANERLSLLCQVYDKLDLVLLKFIFVGKEGFEFEFV